MGFRKCSTIEFGAPLIRRLPTVWDLIEGEISTNEEALSSLPRSFSDNPQLRLLELCDDFRKRVSECIIGRGDSNNFIDDYLCKKYKELADEILTTCPDFQIPEPPDASPNPEPQKMQRLQSPVLVSYPATISSDEAESDAPEALERPRGQEGNNSKDAQLISSYSSSKGQGSHRKEIEETITGSDRHHGSGSRIYWRTCFQMGKALR